MIEPAPKATLARVTALLDIGRTREAVPLAQQLVAQVPEDAAAYCVLSRALLASGDPDGAEQAATSAMRLDPHDSWPLRLLCLTRLEQDRAAEALQWAQRAVELAPAEPLNHESVVVAARTESPQVAAGATRRLLELAPQSDRSHRLAGLVALDRADNAAAAEHLREAIRLDPSQAVVHNDLGVALLRLGQRREALRAFQAAAELDPTSQTSANNIRLMARQDRLPMPAWSSKLAVLMGPGLIVAVARRVVRRRYYRSLPKLVRSEAARFHSRQEAARFGLRILVSVGSLAWITGWVLSLSLSVTWAGYLIGPGIVAVLAGILLLRSMR